MVFNSTISFRKHHIFRLVGLILLSACAAPQTPYHLLSDEVVSSIKSPPYSIEQVKQAQDTLRYRLNSRLSETTIQSDLKSFACLIVAQKLDPSTARGSLAPSELPCTFNSKKKCAHHCKQSRLPREILLPKEYQPVAHRHDEILWQDLNALLDSGMAIQWERYLTNCLTCKRSTEAKKLVCLRDLNQVNLSSERIDHDPLDRWLNQCSSVNDPEIQALTEYRKFMLTSPEDLTYPLHLENLPSSLHKNLTTRAIIGEGLRLINGPLNGEAIKKLLQTTAEQNLDNKEWLAIRKKLRRRIDSPLMPCLEHGLDTCTGREQIQLSRKQAALYLRECVLCEHKEALTKWQSQISLGLAPLWQSQENIPTKALLKANFPSALLIHENHSITRLNLESDTEHLVWSNYITERTAEKSILWPLSLHLKQPNITAPPVVLASDSRSLVGFQPSSGEKLWSYRYPFNNAGQLNPCLHVDPIPGSLLPGVLKQGGALCYHQQTAYLLNSYGEKTVALNCPSADGCGDLFTVITSKTLSQSADPKNDPKKSEQDLKKQKGDVAVNDALKTYVIMTLPHPPQDGKTTKIENYLHLYELNHIPKDRVSVVLDLKKRPPLIEVSSIPNLDPSWHGLLALHASHFTNNMAHLVTVQTDRNNLQVNLINLHTKQVIWRKKLKGKTLLRQPSFRKIILEQQQQNTIAFLSDREFSIFTLGGRPIYQEALPTKVYSKEALRQSLKKPLSWEKFGAQLLVLHPFNKKLYYGTKEQKLSKMNVGFEHLALDSYLTSIDGQWVVISPKTGHVYGITPQLDQVIWKWAIDPFKRVTLSSDWALFQFKNQASLFKVYPQSKEELAKKQKDDKPSACSLGDRWACLSQGDQLINLKHSPDHNEQTQKLIEWYNKARKTLSLEKMSLTKVDAMIAQSSWHMSCNWGIAQACSRLGMFAELGFYTDKAGELSQGVPYLNKAYQHYTRAGQLGDHFAFERLGDLYEQGLGIGQNYLKARQSYFRACESGYAFACSRWGFLNELGLGGKKQLSTAIIAYQKACKLGSKWSCDRMKEQELSNR